MSLRLCARGRSSLSAGPPRVTSRRRRSSLLGSRCRLLRPPAARPGGRPPGHPAPANYCLPGACLFILQVRRRRRWARAGGRGALDRRPSDQLQNENDGATRPVLLALVLPFWVLRPPWRAPVTSDRRGGGGGRGLHRRCPHGAGAAGEYMYPCGAQSSLSPRWRTPTAAAHQTEAIG